MRIVFLTAMLLTAWPAIVLASLAPNGGFDKPMLLSCAAIRVVAIQHGPEGIKALARKYRLTRQQRAQADECLWGKTDMEIPTWTF